MCVRNSFTLRCKQNTTGSDVWAYYCKSNYSVFKIRRVLLFRANNIYEELLQLNESESQRTGVTKHLFKIHCIYSSSIAISYFLLNTQAASVCEHIKQLSSKNWVLNENKAVIIFLQLVRLQFFKKKTFSICIEIVCIVQKGMSFLFHWNCLVCAHNAAK